MALPGPLSKELCILTRCYNQTNISSGTQTPHTSPLLACAGVRETNFNNRAYSMKVYAPSRTVSIYVRMTEEP